MLSYNSLLRSTPFLLNYIGVYEISVMVGNSKSSGFQHDTKIIFVRWFWENIKLDSIFKSLCLFNEYSHK